MRNISKIIIIEDDTDDREILKYILIDILKGNNFLCDLIFLEDGTTALDYFKNLRCKPFLIISDINMPGLNGIEMRARMVRDPKLKMLCSPFIFFSTSIPTLGIKDWKGLEVAACFTKPVKLVQYRKILEKCLHIGVAAGSTSAACSTFLSN